MGWVGLGALLVMLGDPVMGGLGFYEGTHYIKTRFFSILVDRLLMLRFLFSLTRPEPQSTDTRVISQEISVCSSHYPPRLGFFFFFSSFPQPRIPLPTLTIHPSHPSPHHPHPPPLISDPQSHIPNRWSLPTLSIPKKQTPQFHVIFRIHIIETHLTI